ncbi:hypothetical protein V0288_24965 [Pannus brasiliensis CCIBt3594]|uniref:Uncharacterized protein n=1 Tax=Pannus brasiliensis CCIBt3594 TaxID=1427578 RepID=A0AAW9R137_9CHRO
MKNPPVPSGSIARSRSLSREARRKPRPDLEKGRTKVARRGEKVKIVPSTPFDGQ